MKEETDRFNPNSNDDSKEKEKANDMYKEGDDN